MASILFAARRGRAVLWGAISAGAAVEGGRVTSHQTQNLDTVEDHARQRADIGLGYPSLRMPSLAVSARRRPVSQARREEILDQASRLLNARGVSQATLQDLATALGVTRNALYHYFDDLEDLLFQVYQRSCDLMARHLTDALQDRGSALDIVGRFVDRCLDPDLPELAALNEYGLLRESNYEMLLSLYDDIISRLARILDAGARSGELRPCHSPTAARTIVSLIHWFPLPGGWITTIRGGRGDLVATLKELLAVGWATHRNRPCNPPSIDLSPLRVRASDGFDQDVIAKVKRETILNNASRMFTCRGVDATTLDEIAAALGTTKARLYRYVGDKQTLVSACFERAERIYVYIMERAHELDGSAMDRIVAVLRTNALAQQELERDPVGLNRVIP